MDFSWPESTRTLIRDCEALGGRLADSRPATPGLDRAGWAACAGAGLLARFGPTPPDPAAPADLRTAVAACEALGRGGADRGLLFALGAHLYGCQVPLMVHADAAQRGRWLPGLADGSLIGALAVTEPQGGSSPDAVQTRAKPTPQGYILSGHKTLITNAPVADLFLVIATTQPERGSFGWTAFLIPAGTPGLQIRPLTTAGLPGAPMGEVILEDCALGSDQVLGGTEGGLRVFTSAMLWERTGILAGFIGAALRDLGAAVAHVNARHSGGEPLAAKQALAHRLAGARLRLERARLMILHAAWAVDTGQRGVQQSVAMAKHEAAEALVETALDLVRIGAGAGWCGALGAVDALRDALGTLFASGTAEIQLGIIAAGMGLKRR